MTYTPIQQRVIDLRMVFEECFNHCWDAWQNKDYARYHQWRRIWEINWIIYFELIVSDDEFRKAARVVISWCNIGGKTAPPFWLYEKLLWRDEEMGFKAWMTLL